MVDTGNLIEAAVGGVVAIKLVEATGNIIDKKTKRKKSRKTKKEIGFKLNSLKI
jgi:hypothetical protein